MVLISAQGVAKSFGDRVLFSGVSFDVRDGERVGLIGANGAGKTTLMNMFTGARRGPGVRLAGRDAGAHAPARPRRPDPDAPR